MVDPRARPAGRDDLLPGIEEQIGHLDALIEQTARVAPQIHDERLHPLALHGRDLLTQLLGRSLAHRIEGDVADPTIEHRPGGTERM